jgi:MerR family transcriptional regulator, light-induced transcriptional regulator
MLYEMGPRARHVYQLLLERIRSGELAPGARLPAHTELAKSFGVAQLTMRHVLARLESDRLVVRERGRGTFVRGADGPQVLIVAADPGQRAELEQQVRSTGQPVLVAATSADALAALEREARPVLAIVNLHLPEASDGLRLVRRLRNRLPDLVLAVLNPTPAQRTRLERAVRPPLLMVGDPPFLQLAQVLRADLPSPGDSVAQRLELLLNRYGALQLAGERASARTLLLRDGIASGLSVHDLYQGVLARAQYRVGELWQSNQITVAREHLATAVTQSLVADLAATASRVTSNRVGVLVACVEGEQHDIGARMVADMLDLDGFSVRFLGADVPTGALLSMLREESPRLLVLSAAMTERVVALRTAVARVRQVHGAGLRIFVGGQVMRWAADSVRALDVDLAANDALETLVAARRLPVKPSLRGSQTSPS